jgi:hypothetical protein
LAGCVFGPCSGFLRVAFFLAIRALPRSDSQASA